MKLDNLSPLEKAVLEQLWPNKKLLVREIYTLLKRKRKIALTSIAVALDRLYDKRLVDRTIKTGRGGLRYIYSPKMTKEEFERSVIKQMVNRLIDTFGQTAVNYFNEELNKKR